MSRRRPRIAFLFLGETLLIPHLYPIVEAIAHCAAGVRIDAWVATSVHRDLLAGWLADAKLTGCVRVRRVPGFRDVPSLMRGENPPLPPKLPTLFRLLPYLLRVDAIVCAEQTSLWLPRVFPFLRMRFVKTSHGVGSMSARDDPRRRAAFRLLVPSVQERDTYISRGFEPDRVIVTGYVKSAFAGLAKPPRLFADDRPVLVYAPHWQRHRSSWWAWGRDVVAMLATQTDFNVILAPHQRLAEKAPDVRAVLADVAGLPHVHADIDGFAMVDGSYMAAADIYLGDTSSQVIEFLARPRPCIFLDPQALDWHRLDDHGFWAAGEVVSDLVALPAALRRAMADHDRYRAAQEAIAASALGEVGPRTAFNAADAILAAIG